VLADRRLGRAQRLHDRGVFEELDQAGSRWDRPKLAAAIDRVERGPSDGLAVARLDRFGRAGEAKAQSGRGDG
jgi:DNA invertase Pin-like site-specific DNA recombinase